MAGASGAVPLCPLTARGRRQAASAAADPALRGAQEVYASTAARAAQTAEIVAGGLGVRMVQVPELGEIGVGDREGVVDAALRRETADVLKAWVVAGRLDRRVADGETGHEVLARMSAALGRIGALHPGGKAAVVGHLGSLTLALSVLCGLGETVWGLPLPPAVPFRVYGDGSGWHCNRWPDGEPP